MSLGLRYKLVDAAKVINQFNVSVVRKNWKRINKGPLEAAGAYVRRVMRNSIRHTNNPAAKPSPIGKPPRSRDPAKRFKLIRFDVSLMQANVLIGHIGLSQNPVGNTAPQVHEFGDEVVVRIPVARKKARSLKQAAAARRKFLSGKLKSTPRRFTMRTIKMPQRPFALPALLASKTKLPKLWANSVTNAAVKRKL